MEDFDTFFGTPARQVVGLFAAAAHQVPAREDVEIASTVLCEDSGSLMAVFDAAVALRELADKSAAAMSLGTSFERVRAFAAQRIDARDIGTLQRLVGGSLSAECERRLQAAREDTLLKGHHLATAADHYAADVMGSLSALLSLPEGPVTLVPPAGFDVASIIDLPFLSFLDANTTETGHA